MTYKYASLNLGRSLRCAAIALSILWSAQAQEQPRAVLDNPVATLTLNGLSATRERPLFSRSRRVSPTPTASVAKPPALQAPPPPNIELQGTIIGADDTIAIVYSSASSSTLRLRLGGEVDGWKAIAIDERRLVLSLNDRVAEFTIFAGASANDKSAAAQNRHSGKSSSASSKELAPPSGVTAR
jgi:hypothetical protein